MISLSSFDAVIFDMDGTLIDSERPIMAAFHETCERRGLAHQPEVFLALLGLPLAAGKALLRKKLCGEPDVDAFELEWYEATLLHNGPVIPLKPGAQALLDFLSQRNVSIAIATATGSQRAHQKLRPLNVLPQIAHVVCGDEVANGKPAPAIFLEAARRLGIGPSRCLAVEDSHNGVTAALAAGMVTVHVPDVLPHSPELSARGAHHVTSLSALADLLAHA
jgi:beta-phosphoglucomutase-like phosphatase (HAD superfamily)